MAYNDYGCRYPGGHSVIDDGYVSDETTMPKRASKADTSWRPRTKPVKFDNLKVGDRVKYGALGEGVVSSIANGKIYVKFDKRKGKRCFKKKTAEAHMKIVLPRKESASKATLGNRNKGAGISSAETGKDAVRQTVSGPNSRNVETEAWSMKKRAFLGCQVRNRYRKVGLVTSITEGKMKVLFLPKGIEEEFVYPSAFVEGILAVLDRPDTSVQQFKQQHAVVVMNDLMGGKRSLHDGD